MWTRLGAILRKFGATLVHLGLRKSGEVEIVDFTQVLYVFLNIYVRGRSLILGYVGVILGLSRGTWGIIGATLGPCCATLGNLGAISEELGRHFG